MKADETNNRISDQFHIYWAGQPMPKHTKTSPKLVATDVYGLPTSPISLGTTLHFLLRLKCVSPDRISFPGVWIAVRLVQGHSVLTINR